MTGKTKTVLPLLAVLVFFLISCDSKTPVISSIDPRIGRMGEVITLSGNFFGESRDDSFVTIAGIEPTGSSYYLWQDNIIMVRVPELGESGLVFVHTREGRSNGVLFSNTNLIPRPIEGEEFGIVPRIASINPQAGAPGTLITITGNNFGTSRESSSNNRGVFFSWNFEPRSFNPHAVREPEFIEVSETELGYVSWNAREINVRLPDGAVSGNVEVRTPHGSSLPVYFDVSGMPGRKNFSNRRSYTVDYSVDIRVLEATRPNTLYLWIPTPVTSSSQRNVTLVSRSIEPFVENHQGVSLFKLDNLITGSTQSIRVSFNVEVFAVETEITSPLSQEASALSAMYTQSTNLIPAANPQVRTIVNTIIGREQNPYIKARLLYNWILANMEITDTFSGNVEDAIEQRQADPYTTAILYTAMARAAGLPCIPVSGVLIDRNGQTLRHYWTEFWIDDFGWIPVDPVMGMNAVSESFANIEDPAEFYFGNLDSQRIAFSRGEVVLSQIESRGRQVSRTQSYSLQNIWEEASGGLESYSSLWGDIIISGIYIH